MDILVDMKKMHAFHTTEGPPAPKVRAPVAQLAVLWPTWSPSDATHTLSAMSTLSNSFWLAHVASQMALATDTWCTWLGIWQAPMSWFSAEASAKDGPVHGS